MSLQQPLMGCGIPWLIHRVWHYSFPNISHQTLDNISSASKIVMITCRSNKSHNEWTTEKIFVTYYNNR
jgi:hypothetical protein